MENLMILIETDRLIIRPIRLEDAEAMYAYASDPVLAEYVAWDAHKSIEDSLAFIRGAIEHQEVKPLDPLAIAFKDKPDVIIGAIEIKTTSNPYEGIISYVLARQYWRTGLTYEAGCGLVNLAFKEYGFKRIYAFCIKENKASSSLMKKLGMKFEGCLRSRLYRKEQLWDVEYYAILKDEWQQRQSFAEEQEQNEIAIIFDPDPAAKEVNVLNTGLSDNAKKKKDPDPMKSFAFYVKDKKGQILLPLLS
jgi:ribosomal-protein-alanine N-acetyltransferase